MRLLDRLLASRRPAPSPDETLAVRPGDTVGVVLMTTGGPDAGEHVESFLVNRFADPWRQTVPMPRVMRSVLCRWRARREAPALRRAYELIGGSSPLAHHTAEQARLLERRLGDRFGAATGVRFRAYTAMRHWHPSSEEAARQMQADGVQHVVLVPLYPQTAATTTASSLDCWTDTTASVARWPTARVAEFATHPGYVQALAERVDEGLQRFPRDVRSRVVVLYCAQGNVFREGDPYCCHVHATVQAVTAARGDDRETRVAFGAPTVRGRALTPQVRDTLAALAADGHDAVLVVPVSFVADRVETAFDLDVRVRAEAEAAGLIHFEVARGLNGHPLFIEALADGVGSRVRPLLGANGSAVAGAPLVAAADRPRRRFACPTCGGGTAPVAWPLAGAMPEAVPEDGTPLREAA